MVSNVQILGVKNLVYSGAFTVDLDRNVDEEQRVERTRSRFLILGFARIWLRLSRIWSSVTLLRLKHKGGLDTVEIDENACGNIRENQIGGSQVVEEVEAGLGTQGMP
ncbi:hypothetical protein SLEP1_g45752 [Rubroshorea leprosula]|uniref:Uncharacterized protein n=1 Tax=Rubroshorea leprosula TaxID=152421 RepID=A0AAV5LMD2_9ROSI|nr:hypothetical protein SLEP1_g45752 [Rubroshorea leprosula]